MFPFWIDPMYILISLPALLLGLWAQLKIQSAFNRYSRVRAMRGLSGAEVARRVLDFNGLYNVRVGAGARRAERSLRSFP